MFVHSHGHSIYVVARVLQLYFEQYASIIVSCLFALIISASSFVHAAASFVENEDNTPQIPCYHHMAVQKNEKKEEDGTLKRPQHAIF